MPDRSRTHRPADLNRGAASIVGDAVGEPTLPDPDDGKDPAAVSLGRRGGLKGGKARAEKLSPEERLNIARRAAAAQWGPGVSQLTPGLRKSRSHVTCNSSTIG